MDTDTLGLIVLAAAIFFILPIKPVRWLMFIAAFPFIWLIGTAMHLWEKATGKYFDPSGPR